MQGPGCLHMRGREGVVLVYVSQTLLTTYLRSNFVTQMWPRARSNHTLGKCCGPDVAQSLFKAYLGQSLRPGARLKRTLGDILWPRARLKRALANKLWPGARLKRTLG